MTDDPVSKQGRRPRRRLVLMAALPLLLALAGAWAWLASGRYEETENANLRLTRLTIAYLRENYADMDLARSRIAAHVAVSESYLTRIFRRDLGIAPRDYLTRYRVGRAKELLRLTNHTITEIANLVGYNDSAYFSRVFHQETGRSPLTFRRQVR